MGGVFAKFVKQKAKARAEAPEVREDGSWTITGRSEFKLVVVGSGGVGKSALTIKFVSNVFVDEYDPTLEDSYRKPVSVDDTVTMLNILDTAGQEEFLMLRDEWMRSGHGFIVTFSITSMTSFNDADEFRQQILRVKDAERGPMVLVGNKCDLEDTREVSKEKAEAYAKEVGIPYIETSAKADINVDEVFAAVVRECRKVATE